MARPQAGSPIARVGSHRAFRESPGPRYACGNSQWSADGHARARFSAPPPEAGSLLRSISYGSALLSSWRNPPSTALRTGHNKHSVAGFARTRVEYPKPAFWRTRVHCATLGGRAENVTIVHDLRSWPRVPGPMIAKTASAKQPSRRDPWQTRMANC